MWNRRDRIVSVELGLAGHLQWFAEDSAIPTVSIHEGRVCRRLEINAPGAHAHNTEVRWDEGTQRLLVGVWRGRRPNWQQPLKFPGPELFWFRSFYLPNHDGRLARVQVHRGLITIEAPIAARAESAQTRSAPIGSGELPTPVRPNLPATARPVHALESMEHPQAA